MLRKYLKFLFRTRGLTNTLYRAVRIFQRFGITTRKARKNLLQLSGIAQKYRFRTTLPATAIIVKRYSSLFKELQDKNIEFAVHGLYHWDFSQISFQEQHDHMEAACSIFKQYGIVYQGFRAPYLSWNVDTVNAAQKNNFLWTSNTTILWDVVQREDYQPGQWEAYQKVLQHLYRPFHSSSNFSLPRAENGVIEIPVSIPEDEILTDRLGITEQRSIQSIVKMILKETYERGELFTMMLHHERIPLFHDILMSLLDDAITMDPPIWIASLTEIAHWWKARMMLSASITKLNHGKYKVAVKSPQGGQILLRNISSPGIDYEPFIGFFRVKEADFAVESHVRPVIGVAEENSPRLMQFLLEEGWLYEISKKKEDYGLYLEGYTMFDRSRQKDLAAVIETSNAPLIRLWRWPYRAKSALSITGDIDCLTLIDFFKRIFKR